MLKIDNETYKVKDINHHKSQSVKTQILLATSLRKDGHHITRLQHKDYGKTKRWNTFTIARDGMVFQHYDSKFHTDFLEIKEADKKMISIVIENMGALFKTPDGRYINWLNEVCPPENVIEKIWLNYIYWEKFSDAQIESVYSLCLKLCEEHGIPTTCIDFRNFNATVVRYKGIVFRSNYLEDTIDINPLFDIPKFNEALHNELT
jgi:hypothetical protein